MADINIERKSGAGSVLPWIIGLLVLALLAWWLLAGRGDDREDEGTYVDTLTAPATTVVPPATADTFGTVTTTPDTFGTGVTDPAVGTGTGLGTDTGATTTTRP